MLTDDVVAVILIARGGANMIFRENYVKNIMAFNDTPFVKVLTGVRRCGKSTIMQMIMDELRKKVSLS